MQLIREQQSSLLFHFTAVQYMYTPIITCSYSLYCLKLDDKLPKTESINIAVMTLS